MPAPKAHQNPTASNVNHHEKVMHSLALTIFSESGVEAGMALSQLYKWSTKKDSPAKPTPIVIESLIKFIQSHHDHWTDGPAHEPALIAILILMNIINTANLPTNYANSVMIASYSEAILLLFQLSFNVHSPLKRYAGQILTQIARYCDINEIIHEPQKFVEQLCSVFLLANPAKDEVELRIFINFSLFPSNFRLFINQIGADTLTRRLTQLLHYPSSTLRDLILEVTYTICMQDVDFKDAVCASQSLLRAFLSIAIPQSRPMEPHPLIPLTPCQKACTLLLELSSDARVIAFLGGFKHQLAAAVYQWRSKNLAELALKASNAHV